MALLVLAPEGVTGSTMICLHPLPTQGGMMDSHLLGKAAYWLPALANGMTLPRYSLVRELDDYLRPDEGAKHRWVGDSERVLGGVTHKLAPEVALPLPRTWEGPMASATFWSG